MGESGDANHYRHVALTPAEASLEFRLQHKASECFDDDGRLKRTGKGNLFVFRLGLPSLLSMCFSRCLHAGNVWTASAHIITAVIGSGVLSLAWAMGQLGWVAGPAVMLLFSFVTYYTSALLADCYRSGDPLTGKRNYTYMDAVQSNLSNFPLAFCSFLLPNKRTDLATCVFF